MLYIDIGLELNAYMKIDKNGTLFSLKKCRAIQGLGKSDLNGEVTLLQGVICTVKYNLGLSQGDCNGEVFLLVR